MLCRSRTAALHLRCTGKSSKERVGYLKPKLDYGLNVVAVDVVTVLNHLPGPAVSLLGLIYFTPEESTKSR